MGHLTPYFIQDDPLGASCSTFSCDGQNRHKVSLITNPVYIIIVDKICAPL